MRTLDVKLYSKYWEHNCEPHLQEFTFGWEETQNKHINVYIIEEGGAKHYFYGVMEFS